MRNQTNDRPLRWVLTANAVFSAAAGLTLLVAPGWLAARLFAQDIALLGLSAGALLVTLGLGLLVFAGFVALTARQRSLSRGQVKLIVLADLLWVVDSAVVLTIFPAVLSPDGFGTVLIVAVVVLILAVDQVVGLAWLYQGTSEVKVATEGVRMTVTAAIRTKAPAARVWQVMSDQSRYAEVADNLSRTDVLEGQGVGMVRRCTDTQGRSWRETCTLWDEGRAFAFLVDTRASDYPYPIAELSGTWRLVPHGDETEICMAFDIQAKPGLVNRLMLGIMSASFAKVCDRLLQRWVRIMEGEEEPATASSDLPTERISAAR